MSKINIKQILLKDLIKIIKWKNSQTLSNQIMSQKKQIDLETAKKWLKNNSTDKNQWFKGIYIEDKKNDLLIGIVRLMFIDFKAKTTELGIYIGDTNYHGRGIGKQALKIILNEAFSTLNLDKVYLRVTESNYRAISLYESLGFVCEGRLKNHFFNDKEEKFENVLYLSLFKTN